MKTEGPTAAEVFTLRQYSATTLKGIYHDLKANPATRRRGTWEHGRMQCIHAEMIRRGFKVNGERTNRKLNDQDQRLAAKTKTHEQHDEHPN